MQKRIIIILTSILFLLALLVGGEVYWLKKLEKKENSIEKNKIACELNAKTYQPGEGFIIRLYSGCSFCVCGEDGFPTCQKTDCLEGAPNE